MNKLAAMVLGLLVQLVFMLVFLTGFLVLSAVLYVGTAALKLRGWYWEKRYG